MRHKRENRFNGLPHTAETVETVTTRLHPRNTQLKQGVNERLQTAEWQAPCSVFKDNDAAIETAYYHSALRPFAWGDVSPGRIRSCVRAGPCADTFRQIRRLDGYTRQGDTQ